VDGRDEFQQMMRDAALGKFDVVVVFDISRFARDGFDIIGNAKVLKQTFGIDVVDTKNQFDTRQSRNTLLNFVHAGVSEHERLSIMERMIGGRIAKARAGLLWSGLAPTGRGFRKTGKQAGEWFVSERGEKLRELLIRYAAGESLQTLVAEFGFSSPRLICEAINNGQLSGTYVARFNSPEINIVKLEIPVPQVPEVITPELEKRVRDRMAHNKTWNKECLKRYLLSGFIRCGHCGAALNCATYGPYKYFRHHTDADRTEHDCKFNGIRADLLESQVLGYLYKSFLDQPAFDAAVKRSLPSAGDFKKLRKEADKITTRLAAIEKEFRNLVEAIRKGADAGLLVEAQDSLKSERGTLAVQLSKIESELAEMPDPDEVAGQANKLRLILVLKHKGKDWRKLPFDDVRAFLRYLFGINSKKTGHGIFVSKTKHGWEVSFRGAMEFDHTLAGPNLRPVSHALRMESATINRELRRGYQKGIRNANIRRKTATQDADLRRKAVVDNLTGTTNGKAGSGGFVAR